MRRDDVDRCRIHLLLLALAALGTQAQGSPSCAFHTIDGVPAESEGVRFIRLREDAEIGKQILVLHPYPRSFIAIKGAEGGASDHKYFGITELNATTVAVTLTRTLNDLVDRDVPRNLLKFRIVCTSKNEKIEEGSFLSVTVYVEDVNDNAPEFLHTPYVIEVDENTTPGTIIFEGIQAIDRDKPNTPNSELHFSMSTVPEQLSADGSPYFALKSPHRPLLVLKRELDFDAGHRLFRLPLFVWDRGTPAQQANTTITIRVRDVDDLPPKFTEGVYRTKITEFYPLTGAPVRVPLYFSPPIMAFDQDSLNATVHYEIISGNERQLFRVNPHNGIMYLQKEIDLEEESLPGNTFVLQIEARQKDNALKKALARIEIEVLDLNDNLPEFEADFYNISIVENLPTGFSVLQVNAVDRDQGENAEFLYHLIEKPPAIGAFRIDARSGWITVRDDRLLDREQRKAIHLTVEAIERNPPYASDTLMPKPTPSSVRVEITLLDTNDNTPKFEHGNLYEFKVALDAPLGQRIGQVVALDPDDGPNGQVLYELQRPKGSGYIPFRLDTKNGTLFVGGPLRRGRIAIFVEASDQPTNPSERRFSLAVVTIEVYTTIDDQAIDFVGAPYEFWVGAGAPLGTSVGQVRTTLIYDTEDEIMYDLLHTYSEGVPFAIEERSGIITVIRELADFSRKVYFFEAVANYLFANSTQPLVMARSAGKPELAPSTSPLEPTDEGVLITNVTIHVVGKPEQRVPLRPVIEEINMNVITFHIEENVVGGIIGQLMYKNGINVLNNELGTYRALEASNSNSSLGSGSPRAVVKYRSRQQRHKERPSKRRLARRLANDAALKLRYIIANQQEVLNKITITEDGTLLTLTALDREQKASYDLTVIVEYTTGLVSGAGIYQVNVRIDDVNDNAPTFGASRFVGLINENCATGTELSLDQPITVSDADVGPNALFQVLLQGDYADQFSIELVNGSSNGTAMQRPIFGVFNLTEQWSDDMKLLELQTLFAQPSQATASAGSTFRVTYTGKRPLDRETIAALHLKLIAIDTGGLSSFAQLHILVADVNDNAPIFERISVFKAANIEIREYTTDLEIYFVDSTFGAPLESVPPTLVMSSYLMPGSPRHHSDTNGDSDSDSDTGPHPLNATLNASPRRGRLRLRGRSRRRKARSLPQCPLFAIAEDIPLATKVLQVTASDDDFGKNAQVHYELTGEHVERSQSTTSAAHAVGARYFALDRLTGELRVNFPLPANAELQLNLSATDIDGLQDTTCLRFSVLDVNDHAPVFKKSWYSFDTAEGSYEDSVLGQVLAVDLDFGANANVTYALNDSQLPFAISSRSGVLRIHGTLDREKRDKYTFQVIASDAAEPPLLRLSSTVDIEVNIVDVNDNQPEFMGFDETEMAGKFLPDTPDKEKVLPLYRVYLDRSSSAGIFVRQVTAIDKDDVSNGNGLVLYSLLHQDSHGPAFQIDARDGIITTVGSFRSYNDYEHLNLSVIASDLGSPPLSATAIVLINLQGQAVTEAVASTTTTTSAPSPNAALFQYQYHELEVLENNVPPTPLLHLNLSADTSGEALRWHLSLETESNELGEADMDARGPPFAFDAASLTLSAVGTLDRETVARYQLRLRAERPNREARNYAKLQWPVVDERLHGLEPNECRIVVRVLDDNDNAPRFRHNGQPIVAVVPRSASFGYPVTVVQASDADEGLNAEIRYRLLNEPSRLFGIDERTGKIRLVAAVPHDERLYGFDVKATDRRGADDGRSSIANVFVYIVDEARQVRLVLAGRPLDVERRIDKLVQALSEAIQLEVRVRLLEPHVGGSEPATDAYIYAVDHRSNSVVDMEQLQETLAGLQLDVLQRLQLYEDRNRDRDRTSDGEAGSSPDREHDADVSMPRIIELAEWGKLSRNSQHSGSLMAGIEIVCIVLLALCGVGAALTALCCFCLRHKRSGSWPHGECASSETGLTYSVRAGLDRCRQHRNTNGQRHRNQSSRSRSPSSKQKQRQELGQSGKSTKTSSSFLPESVCSSAQTQSTLAASQKFDPQQQQQQQSQQQQHHHHHQHQHQPLYQNQAPQAMHDGGARQREYIDVPLPKSITKASAASSMPGTPASPFMLKYNSSQPVSNLRPTNPYDTSLFSLHSVGQDSGVDFLSSRELYESTPSNSFHLPSLPQSSQLCPRHASHVSHVEIKRKPMPTDSSDNYEDSLRHDEPLVAPNYRNPGPQLCEYHHHCRSNTTTTTSTSATATATANNSSNSNGNNKLYAPFEKRSSVRHSFSGVRERDDLVQHSPHISLRPRGHTLRNSMSDLEERLHNLEESFRRPLTYAKSNSIF